MAIIPKFFMDAVVALGVTSPNGGKKWIGTGFLVERKEKTDPNQSTVYLITNKHVVKNNPVIYVRFNSLGDRFIMDYPVPLLDEAGNMLYSEHLHPSTDIIALQISPQTLIKDKSIWAAFDLNKHALTLTQMKDTGVQEGSLVYGLGFPLGIVDVIKSPVCRLGCISRIWDSFVRIKEFPTFLVDAQAFPGNSGGPIISRPEMVSINGTPSNQSANLIGILSSYISYRDALVSQQTHQPVMFREENSGLTVVHPVDRIKEVVELEWERMEKLKTNGKTDNCTQTEAIPVR